MKTNFRLTTFWLTTIVAAGLGTQSPFIQAAAAPVRVLIFSGQNNHDWKTTTPRLKTILTDSGRFTVETTEHPERCTAETLARYDLILSDWNSWGNAAVKEWPAATRAAFLDFIRSGKGYVSVHAGSSSFYDWPEYQQIGGLYWNLAATSHGAPHEFTVQFSRDHPVTRGLSPFKTKDELWLKPGVHPAAQVLATGDDHALAVATSLGQGRGFALLLGHSADFMATSGAQTLLLRGAEWAATGKVMIRGVGDASALDPDEVIRRVGAYRFGDSRRDVLALEKLVFAVATDAEERQSLARKLASALSGDATMEGKRCYCEGLSLIGPGAEVSVLANALADTNLFYHARLALERIPVDEAAAALQAALAMTSGSARASLIDSLAARHANKALPDIARFATDADREVAGSAIEALGKLGGLSAATALQALESGIAPELRERYSTALLNCAVSLQASGRGTEATALLAKLIAPGQPAAVRIAAFAPYASAWGTRGPDQVLAALSGEDLTMQSAAIRALRSSTDPALLRSAVERLQTLPPKLQEATLVLVGERADVALLPAVLKTAASSNPVLKVAAIRALGLIGDGSAVKPLVQLIGAATSEELKVLADALARLRGTDVDAALAGALRDSPAAAQRLIIRALVLRVARGTTAALLQVATSPDTAVRREAITAVGKLADAGACKSLIQLLDRGAENERSAFEGALVDICQRDSAAIPGVAAALPQVGPASQMVLLGVLGAAGGSPACAAVRGQLQSGHTEVRLAAVRVLAEWPDAEPLDDLAAVAETTSDARIRALAVRGLNRMAPQAPDRATRVADSLARALSAASEVADQKSFLMALIGIPCVPSLKAAQAQLKKPELANEAAAGMVSIAEVVYPWHHVEVKAALAELKSANPSADLVRRADALAAKLDQPANFAIGGLATSPDGLEKDGAAGGDPAAIDGDPKTYWDEEDSQKLYRLQVRLRERSTVGCIRLTGWQQHNYAPKDFEVLCDDKVVKTVRGAAYTNNRLTLDFPAVQCDRVELRITGYYGQSPAIRELEIYEKPLP